MRTFRKTIAIVCIFALIASIGMLSAGAVPAPLTVGNVDLSYSYISDSEIDIKDATLVQKFLAGLEELDKRQMHCADTDFDGNVTIKDATMIQKKIAGIIKRFPFPDDYYGSWDYTRSNCFYADYDSGNAMTGVPVTFTAQAYGGDSPFTYEYKVNGEVIRERSEDNTCTYIFEEAGVHNVQVVMYNYYDTTCTNNMEYEVVEPYTSDKLMIQSLYYDNNTRFEYNYDTTVTANAFMGSGDYEYCFWIDEDLIQDFSSKNTLSVQYGNLFDGYEECLLTVYVRDTADPDYVVSKQLPLHLSHAIG